MGKQTITRLLNAVVVKVESVVLCVKAYLSNIYVEHSRLT